MKIAYLCDKKVAYCSKGGCLLDNMCTHTTDEHYALNGPCEDPEKYPERFISSYIPSTGEKYYWEREGYRNENT